MRKPSYSILAALLLSVLGATITFFPRSQEPLYKGHSLTYWLQRIGSRPSNDPDIEAIEAIQAIGTNGLPLLLDWIRSEPQPTPAKEAAKSALARIPDAVTPDVIVQWTYDRPQSERAAAAAYAIHLLGAQADLAIPDLRKLISAPYKGDVPMRAIIALAEMGPTPCRSS